MSTPHLAVASPFAATSRLLLPLVAGLAAASLPAQNLPELGLTLKIDTEPPVDHRQIESMGFVQLEIGAEWAAAGTWCFPLIDFCVADPNWLAGEPELWRLPLAPSSVPLGEIVGATPGLTVESSPFVSNYVQARVADHDLFTAALGAPAGSMQYCDALWRPREIGAPILQYYGTDPMPGWTTDTHAQVPTFHIDALLQWAAWRRLEPVIGGQMTRSEFFSSSNWTTAVLSQGQLAITMVGLRSPQVLPRNVPVDEENGVPPVLLGFPNTPPKITVSGSKTITFVGSALTAQPRFWPPAAQEVPLYLTTPGGQTVLPMSGYLPGMQVAFSHLATGARREVDVEWVDYGVIRVTMPLDAVTGHWELAGYRYPLAPPATGYTTWSVLPADQRPDFMVQ